MRRPWFAFYVSDFEQDETVKLANNRVLGAYVRLLCHQWSEGSLPTDRSQLATIARESDQDFARIWPTIAGKFKRTGKRLRNARMEKERQEAEARSVKAKEAAGARWADAPAMRSHSPEHSGWSAQPMPPQSQSQPQNTKDLRIDVGSSKGEPAEEVAGDIAARVLRKFGR